jgi:hypothetical protein
MPYFHQETPSKYDNNAVLGNQTALSSIQKKKMRNETSTEKCGAIQTV